MMGGCVGAQSDRYHKIDVYVIPFRRCIFVTLRPGTMWVQTPGPRMKREFGVECPRRCCCLMVRLRLRASFPAVFFCNSLNMHHPSHFG